MPESVVEALVVSFSSWFRKKPDAAEIVCGSPVSYETSYKM